MAGAERTILAIDTATAACSVALLRGDHVVAHAHDVVGRGHAERLMPMIASLPDGGRADAIMVDCGPGSFTGVRVGLAAARALGFGWSVPVHGYSSTALIAAAAGGAAATIAVALTGGHGELFVQRYARDPLAETTPLASLRPDVAAALFDEDDIFGSGAAALVGARGHGEAHDLLPDARWVHLLPPALSSLPPRPKIGRAHV
jgi:tRNA threonylcarbamoyl adenosine modification protein YeaZ